MKANKIIFAKILKTTNNKFTTTYIFKDINSELEYEYKNPNLLSTLKKYASIDNEYIYCLVINSKNKINSISYGYDNLNKYILLNQLKNIDKTLSTKYGDVSFTIIFPILMLLFLTCFILFIIYYFINIF